MVSLTSPMVWGIIFVVVLLIEIAIVANIKAQDRGRKESYEARVAAPALGDDEELTDYLSRFVEDGKGERVGETVGFDGDLVIIKSGADYKAVPRKHMSFGDDAVTVHGVVSWGEAERLGREWAEKQHRVVDYSPEELPEDERAS